MSIKNERFSTKALFKLTIPTIVMMSFMSLYTMTDGAFVSRGVSTDALSAVNLAYPYINFILGVSIMLGSGGCALVMKKIGEGKQIEARKDFSLIISTAIIFSIIVTLFSLIFMKEIIVFLGATDTLYEYCKDYLFYMIIFVTPTILKFIFEQFLVAVNKANLALILSVTGGILNVVLDYLFIIVFGLGIKGAAIATGIGYAVPAIVGLVFFFFKKNSLYYDKPSKDIKVILKSCSNGSSEMVSQLSTGIITFLFNQTMLRLMGEDGVAAITIILYINFLVIAIYLGYSIGIMPKISFYYGSGDKNMLRDIVSKSLKFIWISSILIYILVLIFTPTLISFFTERSSNVFDITLKGLRIYSLSFILVGTNIFMSSMFTAFSNGLVSATISFLRSLVFESLGIIILALTFSVSGVWFAVPLAQFLGIIVSLSFYFKYKKIYGY